MYWILYFITIIISYIILRYLVITKKYGFSDDPQVVTLLMSIFWPVFLFVIGISECGNYIDKFIKLKLNN